MCTSSMSHLASSDLQRFDPLNRANFCQPGPAVVGTPQCPRRSSADALRNTAVPQDYNQLLHKFLEMQTQLCEQQQLLTDVCCALYNQGFSRIRLPNGVVLNLADFESKGRSIELIHDQESASSFTSSSPASLPLVDRQLDALDLRDSNNEIHHQHRSRRNGYLKHQHKHTMSTAPRSAGRTCQRLMSSMQHCNRQMVLPSTDSEIEQLEWLSDITGLRGTVPHVDDYLHWLQARPRTAVSTEHLQQTQLVDPLSANDPRSQSCEGLAGTPQHNGQQQHQPSPSMLDRLLGRSATSTRATTKPTHHRHRPMFGGPSQGQGGGGGGQQSKPRRNLMMRSKKTTPAAQQVRRL